MNENTAEGVSKMYKAEKLRAVVSERLDAATREILAILDTFVAAYEEEASGFRQEINRQRRQLEVLQVTVSSAGAKSSRSCVEEEEGEDDSTGPSRSSEPPGQRQRRRPGRQKAIALSIRILEDSQISALSENAMKKCPALTLRCPPGLQEADFLALLRSAVPQLAGDDKPFDLLTSDRRRRLKPLKLKTVTPEEILRNLGGAGLRSAVHIRLKTQEEPPGEIQPLQAGTSSCATPMCDGSRQQTSVPDQAVAGSRSADAEDEDAGEDAVRRGEEASDSSWNPDASDEERKKSDSKLQSKKRKAKLSAAARTKTESAAAAVFPCRVCGAPSGSEVALAKHAWSHEGEAGSVCGVCGESAEELRDHLLSRHKTADCHVCGESFLGDLALSEHVAAHAGELEGRGHRCPTCHKAFELQAQLKAHRRTHAHSKTYLCGVCGKFLRDGRSLSRHKKTHSVERPHGCRVCGRGFKLPTTLKQHEKIHTSRERPYLCDVCCKMFLTGKQLAIHMRTHTNEKPYRCDECGKGFTTKGPLTIHMRVHTGETPYRCPHCGWSFKRKTHLDNHMAIHTGAKPYVCGICGKSCARKTYLTVHMRTHNGERPYKCSVCDKAFTQSHCLKTHMRSHQAEPPAAAP
ncbi:uncharacterized protein PAE49_021702 [Odontesthes bonariensis]|uniref:uncharacterized protein LOC142368561 n=1 Tax=Odontesthes bonariensis TaxID=219752 RepID=UPI003F58BF02